jgi:hypothetical protein
MKQLTRKELIFRVLVGITFTGYFLIWLAVGILMLQYSSQLP